MQKQHFLDLTPSDISKLLNSINEPKFRAKQLNDWIFKKKIFNLNKMVNIPSALITKLQERLDFSFLEVQNKIDSNDGATKLLLKTSRGLIETVILRYENRVSLCISSQVGCKLACSFCQTGKLGFVRNLAKHEIMVQFALAQEIVAKEGRSISHIVFMGMGEPLNNYENVKQAISAFTGADSFNLSKRHVTLSTSGVADKIIPLAKECDFSLAVSLHAANNKLRSELMPINKKFSLEVLKTTLLEYQKLSNRKITIEYILLKNINTSIKDAKELVKFIHGLRAKVNLIPYNDHPGMPYARPKEEEILLFQKYLADRSIPAPVRYSKGLDVSAACGQLAAKTLQDVMKKPDRGRVINRLNFEKNHKPQK